MARRRKFYVRDKGGKFARVAGAPVRRKGRGKVRISSRNKKRLMIAGATAAVGVAAIGTGVYMHKKGTLDPAVTKSLKAGRRAYHTGRAVHRLSQRSPSTVIGRINKVRSVARHRKNAVSPRREAARARLAAAALGTSGTLIRPMRRPPKPRHSNRGPNGKFASAGTKVRN